MDFSNNRIKDGEQRPMFSALMEKVRRGEYQQLLFSEFSRLDRKPSNLLRTLETLQKQNIYLLLPAYITLSIYSPDGEVVGAEWLAEWLASQGGIGLEADVFR